MNDGIIEGQAVRTANDKCHACGGAVGVLIKVSKITLPEGIKPGKTLIAYRDEKKAHGQIGVTCGCYARFHRQVAHIQGRMKK